MREYNVYTRTKGDVNASEYVIGVWADNKREARNIVANEISLDMVVSRVERA